MLHKHWLTKRDHTKTNKEMNITINLGLLGEFEHLVFVSQTKLKGGDNIFSIMSIMESRIGENSCNMHPIFVFLIWESTVFSSPFCWSITTIFFYNSILLSLLIYVFCGYLFMSLNFFFFLCGWRSSIHPSANEAASQGGVGFPFHTHHHCIRHSVFGVHQ